MAIKLSFCIPTYNRGAYLGRLIESIASQWTDEVEIVISDNASTDNTEEVIREYQRKYPRIIYEKAEMNMGADKNYLRAIELANGDYCWLFGSDDYLAEGAIERLLYEIEEKHKDIYLTTRLEKSGEKKWLDIDKDNEWNLSNKNDYINYLQHVKTLGGLFSYLSSIIVRRKAWMKTETDFSYIGTAYAHVQKIVSMIKDGNGKIMYINKPYPKVGDGEDSFSVDGYLKRILIDLDGYKKLADDYYGNDVDVYSSFLNVMKYEHDFSVMKFFRWSGHFNFYEQRQLYNALIDGYGVNRNLLYGIMIISPIAHVMLKIKSYLKF